MKWRLYRPLVEDNMQTQIEIHTEPLNIQACIDWIMSPDSGGIDVFIGTVRNANKGKLVLKLEFEAYNQMAINEIKKITKQTILKISAVCHFFRMFLFSKPS